MDFIKSLRSGSSSTVNKPRTINRSRSAASVKNDPALPVTAKPPSNLKNRFNEIKCPGGANRGQSNTDRLKAQRMETRRNQRANMYNNHRVIDDSVCANNETVLDSNLQSTFMIPDNLSPRKKKLAFWRAQREAQKKVDKRPVFKVTHCDPKLFERPKSTMTKSYSFADRTTNRSSNMSSSNTSYRQNSTLLRPPVPKREVHHFGSDVNSSNGKFTFSASVETFQDFVKRRESSPKKFDDSTPFIRNQPNPEMESILNSLKPEDRDFFNQTLEGRNNIMKSTNLTQVIDNANFTTPMIPQQVPTKKHEETIVIVKPTEDTSVSKSIDKITKRMDETLTIDQSKTPVVHNPAPVEFVVNKHSLATIEEKFNTPVKPLLVTERINTPIAVIAEKVIISPIKTEMAEKIENGDADSNFLESVQYYRNLVINKTKQLNELSNKWNTISKEIVDPPLTEDNQGSIFFAVGVANLLIKERFSQFNELIDKCEDTNTKYLRKELDDKLVKASDLQGFWDMINHQVVDVEKNFFNLAKLKENNWVEVIEVLPRVVDATVKPRIKIDPLKKFRKANSEDADAAEKPKPKPKGPVKSKFAEFRAKMAAEKAAKDSAKIEDVVVSVVEKATPTITPVAAPVVQETPEEITPILVKPNIPEQVVTNERRSIKPVEAPLNAAVPDQKKYNLRQTSRRSDLIRFESPAATRSPKTVVTKGIFTLPNFESTIVETNENEAAKPAEPALCFDFDDDYEPIVFGKNKKKEVASNKENQLPKRILAKQSSKENNPLVSLACSPKTPQNLRQREIFCNSGEITKSNPSHMKCISNSPLLKLAMISSHGKRQSLSTNKNARLNGNNNCNDSYVQQENTINFG